MAVAVVDADGDRPIVVHLGGLPMYIHSGLLRAFMAAQLPNIEQLASDPKHRMLQAAFKAAARLTWDLLILPKVRRGEMPAPDMAAVKRNNLTALADYLSNMIISGVQSCEWELLFVERPNGWIEVTGVAPADESPAATVEPVAIEPPTIDGSPDAAAEAAQQSDPSTDGRSLVRGGDIGERQNDVGQASDSGLVQAVE